MLATKKKKSDQLLMKIMHKSAGTLLRAFMLELWLKSYD